MPEITENDLKQMRAGTDRVDKAWADIQFYFDWLMTTFLMTTVLNADRGKSGSLSFSIQDPSDPFHGIFVEITGPLELRHFNRRVTVRIDNSEGHRFYCNYTGCGTHGGPYSKPEIEDILMIRRTLPRLIQAMTEYNPGIKRTYELFHRLGAP